MKKKNDKGKKYYLFEMQGTYLNIFSLVLLFILFLLTYLIKGNGIFDIVNSLDWAMLFFIPYLILHEILHSVGYVLMGADFKNITYGAHIEKGVLCCLCKQNITKQNILVSLLFPFMIIGVITYVIGLVCNIGSLVLLSIFNLSGCSGDLIMFWHLSRIKDFEFSEYDNPMAFGLYSSEDLSKKKMFGLKFLESKDELEKKETKKVTISKISIAFFIIYFALTLVNLLLG